ncbi:MAG: hypothetical protein HY063_09325 [Bacteroidetes bacterium]|nr:hypothetical protein [Bacteroidota bacterium]
MNFKEPISNKENTKSMLERHRNELQLTHSDLLIQIADCEKELKKCNELLEFYTNRFEKKNNESVSEIVGVSIEKNGNNIEKSNGREVKKEQIKWKVLVLECLKRESRPLKTASLLNIIFPKVSGEKREDLYFGLSSSLHGFIRTGTLKRVHSKGKGFLYGLPEWFDGSKLKQEVQSKLRDFKKELSF